MTISIISVMRSRLQRLPFRRMLLLPVLAVLLSSCAGGPANSSWPGLAVQDGVAYLAINNHVSAVDLSSGQMKWQYPPKGKLEPTLLFYSNPLLDSKGKLVAGSYDGSILQLDLATGNLVWRNTDNKKQILGSILEGPDGNYYLSPENAGLLVVHPADGSTVRSISLDGGSVWGVMAADSERVYAATLEHKLFAIRVKDGVIEWTRDLETSVAGGVSLIDGKLYLGTFSNKALALAAADGDTIWEVPAKGWVWQPPVVDGNIAYIVDVIGTLQAVSLNDGKVIWTVALEGAVQAPLVVADGTLYVGLQSGKVRAFSTTDGHSLWEQTLEGNVYGSLQVEGDRLLLTVLGAKYQLASLIRSSGAIQWTYAQPTE